MACNQTDAYTRGEVRWDTQDDRCVTGTQWSGTSIVSVACNQADTLGVEVRWNTQDGRCVTGTELSGTIAVSVTFSSSGHVHKLYQWHATKLILGESEVGHPGRPLCDWYTVVRYKHCISGV